MGNAILTLLFILGALIVLLAVVEYRGYKCYKKRQEKHKRGEFIKFL